MKKVLGLLLLIVGMTSCTKDNVPTQYKFVAFDNIQSMSVTVNGNLVHSGTSTAYVDLYGRSDVVEVVVLNQNGSNIISQEDGKLRVYKNNELLDDVIVPYGPQYVVRTYYK